MEEKAANSLQSLFIPINNSNLINNANNISMFNETLSIHKRYRDREHFSFENYSPINSLGLNSFTPMMAKESPSIQRVFNFNIDEKNFTPTPSGVYSFNRFNFLAYNNNNNTFIKPAKTPQDMKSKEHF